MYGLLITSSILISALFLERELKKEGKNLHIFWGLVFWTIITGVIGARLYHVAHYSEFYLNDPKLIFQIWKGGLGIYGAIMGGLIGGIIYLKLKKETILPWTDSVFLAVPFIQAISRWGNFFNQEIYGKPTTLPWGMYITSENEKVHPLFLYESLLNLGLFLILWILHKQKRRGLVTFSYLIGYGIIRLVLEEFRLDPWQIYGLNVAQVISILIIVASVFGLLYETKFNRK